jgi:hypothetical protein
MTTPPQAPMADVGEMYLVHTMSDPCGFRLAAPDELCE